MDLQKRFSDSSILVFNFGEGDGKGQLMDVLRQYGMMVMDYPKEYQGCPILTLELIHSFLSSADRWLSSDERHEKIILLHCQRESWPTVSFMLAGLLIYRKRRSDEQETLMFIHKIAPKGLMSLLSAVDLMPSQVRYLQYISQRHIVSKWPPPEQALMVYCLILRIVPSFDTKGGCRPLIRIYGLNPLDSGVRTTKMLFNKGKDEKSPLYIKQVECSIYNLLSVSALKLTIILC
jgi:hypothetical protein